jgi:hypothetical protein
MSGEREILFFMTFNKLTLWFKIGKICVTIVKKPNNLSIV